MFQIAEESSTTQLLEKLKEKEADSPEKIKTEPVNELLLSISEELIDWPLRDKEHSYLFRPSGSGLEFNFPGPSDLEGYHLPPSPESPTVKLSKLRLGNLPALEDIRDKDISPEFA